MRPNVPEDTKERIDRVVQSETGVDPSYFTFDQKLKVLLDEVQSNKSNTVEIVDSGLER